MRSLREEDLEAVLEIELASFSRPWTRGHFLDELASPFGHPILAQLADGTVAGYLFLRQVLDEAEILDVAVSRSLRGRGIGRLLVEAALAAARERGAVFVALEVRVGNHEAIALYRNLGFRETGLRKGYYDNGEDAILMEYSYAV